MFSKKENETINESEELNALIEYVNNRWEGVPKDKMAEFISFVWNEASKALPHNFNEFLFTSYVSEFCENRRNASLWNNNISKEELKFLIVYDNIYSQISNILTNKKDVRDYILKDWDYSKFNNKLVNKVREEFPFINNIKPFGWDEFKKDYIDFKGQEEYCEHQQDIDDNEFKGVDSNGCSSFGFQTRIALPYAMYDDICQGRNPLYVMVSAIVSHKMFVTEHNNSVVLLNDFKDLLVELNSEKYKKEIVFAIDLVSMVNNNILKAIFALNEPIVKTVDELKKELKNQIKAGEDFELLSDDEKLKIQEEHKKQMRQMIEEMKLSFNKGFVKDEEKENKKNGIISDFLNENDVGKSKYKPS